MRSITRGRRPHRLLGLALLAAMLGIVAGAGTLSLERTPAHAQTPNVQIQKEIIGPNGMIVTGADLSGFRFTLTANDGEVIMTGQTDAAGMVGAFVTPNKTYELSEVVPAGRLFVGSPVFFVLFGTARQQQNSVVAPAMGAANVDARNQVAGTASLTITKQIIDANNQPVLGADVSNFGFIVSCPACTPAFQREVTTTANGTVMLSNLPAGVFTVTEQPRANFVLVNAAVGGVLVPAGTTPTFQLGLGQNQSVLFNNRFQATGTVNVTKQVVDASGNAVAGANLANFQFTLTCGTASPLMATTSAMGVATFSNVPAGTTCQLNETVPTGFTFVSATPAGGAAVGNPGNIMVSANGTLSVAVVNRQAATTQAVPLPATCSNQTLTWPVGTPISTVAAAITPAGALESIFRLDPVVGRFRGFSPTAPAFVNDYTVIETDLEPVFICMRQSGTLNRPIR